MKPDPKEFSELAAQLAIRNSTKTGVRCLTNFSPLDWFECDFAQITPAGYLVEYEIKCSVADFNRDALKCSGKKFDRTTRTYINGRNKHAEIEARGKGAPRRFWFVVPKNMIQAEDVPAWAGLKYFKGPYQIRTVKEAPNLHSRKACPKVIKQMDDAFFWRFWSATERLYYSK